MSKIPSLTLPDNSISLLMEGYPFLLKAFEKQQTDILEARLALTKVICLTGESGAKLFYDNDRFIRKGVVPDRVKNTLFGHGGVHGLDGDRHQHRKAMFMSIMTPQNIQRLKEIMKGCWQDQIKLWENKESVQLLDGAKQVIFKGIYDWAGVPYAENEANTHAQHAFDMIDAFGGLFTRHYKGKYARKKHEEWLMSVIRDVRNDRLKLEPHHPAYIIANHRNPEGELLDVHTAAVELSNSTRPAVALAYFVAFAALALHEHPQLKSKLVTGDEDYLKCFVQEVRRFYPFVPFLGAGVKTDFDWNGYHFPKGRLVLLDIYGTLHDPTIWDKPEVFNPDRFFDWDQSPFNFISQGGGDFDLGHRCAGEWTSIEILKISVQALTRYMTYEIPDQDLSYDLTRFPTFPKSQFVITDVKRNES